MIISVSSLKGGAGKTAVSIFLSQLLSEKGRVLAVDLDHNNNLTDYFLRSRDTDRIESANVYHVISGRLAPEDCIHIADDTGISVLPATPHLARIGIELSRDPGALLRFARTLRQLDFAAIVMDTPPALCFELSCALYAAEIVLSPVSLSRWTVQGFALLEQEVRAVSGATGKTPRLLALPAQVNTAQDKKLRTAKLAEYTRASIHRSAAIKSACDSGKPLKENCGSYAEFKELAQELV